MPVDSRQSVKIRTLMRRWRRQEAHTLAAAKALADLAEATTRVITTRLADDLEADDIIALAEARDRADAVLIELTQVR